MPTAAIPSGTTAATASVGLRPIIVRVPMSNENDTTSGKLVALWIPSTAQTASSTAKIVSSTSRSTPPSASALACSA